MKMTSKPDQTPSLQAAAAVCSAAQGGGICVEVGTWEGDFSAALLRLTNCRKLYCVDPYKHFDDDSYPDGMNKLTQVEFDAKFAKTKQRLETEFGDRVIMLRLTSLEAAKLFENGSIDFVYIDGNHDYKAVLEDVLTWYPKLKSSSGVLCGDDIVSTVLAYHDKNGNVKKVWGPNCWGYYGTYKAIVDSKIPFIIDGTQFKMQAPPSVTIVSAYYKIPSKRSHEFYMNAMNNFFTITKKSRVVFFTTEDLLPELQTKAGPFVQFYVLPIESWTAWTVHPSGSDFWARQHELDAEKYHIPDLSALWFEKKEFVWRAMQIDKWTDRFLWCDAGCVREEIDFAATQQGYGFGHRLAISDSLDKKRLHIQSMKHTKNREAKQPFYSYPFQHIAGAIQIGTRDVWSRHRDLYNKVLFEYDKVGISGNSDQYVLLRCAETYPELYEIHEPPTQSLVNPWFHMLAWL
jgi:hypothetical protein